MRTALYVGYFAGVLVSVRLVLRRLRKDTARRDLRGILGDLWDTLTWPMTVADWALRRARVAVATRSGGGR